MKNGICAVTSVLLLVGSHISIRKATAFAVPSTLHDLDFPKLLTQASSASAAYVGLVFLFDRPSGKLLVENPTSTLRVGPSQVPNAGLGLYATRSLPEGTLLGTYPGVVRPLQSTALSKLRDHPQCEAYVWRFTDNAKIIDPTDELGMIQDECYGGSNNTPFSNLIMKTFYPQRSSTILARINEPPLGFDCNVRSSEDLETRKVLFEISRDVYAEEELFMDYGLTYDRSKYTGE